MQAFEEWVEAQNAAMRVQIALTSALQLQGTTSDQLRRLHQELKDVRERVDGIVEKEINRRGTPPGR